MLQNLLDLQIFECSSYLIHVLKTVKIGQSKIENRMVQFFQTLPNLVILLLLHEHSLASYQGGAMGEVQKGEGEKGSSVSMSPCPWSSSGVAAIGRSFRL
jgi:hypothetical protein